MIEATCSRAVDAISVGTNWVLDAVVGALLLAEGREDLLRAVQAGRGYREFNADLYICGSGNIRMFKDTPSKSRVIFILAPSGASTFRTMATSFILDFWQPKERWDIVGLKGGITELI